MISDLQCGGSCNPFSRVNLAVQEYDWVIVTNLRKETDSPLFFTQLTSISMLYFFCIDINVLRLVLMKPLYRNMLNRIYYRPQRSWGKVIFSQASVILFMGGGCLSACLDTTHPLAKRPPLVKQTPPARRSPGKEAPLARQTPWQGEPPPGKADPPGKEFPLARRPPVKCMLGDTVNTQAVCILLECNSCLLAATLHLFWGVVSLSPLYH